MESIKEELKEAANMFKEDIEEHGWVNSAQSMQNIWLNGANFAANLVVRRIAQLDENDLNSLFSSPTADDYKKQLAKLLGF